MAKQNALEKFTEVMQASVINAKDAVVEGARAVSNSHHSAALHALVRQGAREVAQVLQAFPDSNVRPVEEAGQIFNPTPQEVFLNKTGRELDIEMGR